MIAKFAEAYLEMKFSAAEHNIRYELSYLSGLMHDDNSTTVRIIVMIIMLIIL